MTSGEVTSARLLFNKLLIYSPHTPGCFTVLGITSAFFSLYCSAGLPQHVFFPFIYLHFNGYVSIYLSILDIRGKNGEPGQGLALHQEDFAPPRLLRNRCYTENVIPSLHTLSS